MPFSRLLPMLNKPTQGGGVSAGINEGNESQAPATDEVIELWLKQRDIGGTVRPLSVELVTLLEGESLIFKLPMSHVMESQIIINGVTSSLKDGGGVAVDTVRVMDTGLDVLGRIRTTTSPSQSSLAAIQLTLSNGDIWEVNVPIWVDY